MAVTLDQIALFSDLDEAELEKLSDVVQEESVLLNTQIFREGDPSDSFYIITRGSIRIVKELPDGTQRELATLREGEFFGEMGVMKDSPRSASAYSVETTRLLRIGRRAFLSFLDANPIIAMKVRSAMVRRYSDNVFSIAKNRPGGG